RGPGPNVAPAVNALLILGDVASLGVTEGPNLVAFDSLGGQESEGSVLIGRGRLAEIDQQGGDRVPGRTRHPRGGSDRVSLDQCPDDRRPFGPAQSVHIDTMRERCDNSLSQPRTEIEKRLGAVAPARKRSLASATRACLGC